MRPILLSTLASVAAHGAVVVVATLTLVTDDPVSRPACVLAFQPDEAEGAVDAIAESPPPAEPRLDDGTWVEPPVTEPIPPDPVADAMPVVEPEEAELPAPPTPSNVEDERAPTVLPALTSIPPRPRSLPSARAATTVAASAPDSMPVAMPGRFASTPSVRGAAGISVVSRGRPTNRAPSYPAVALENRWEGTTWLVIEILADGSVSRVLLEQSSGYAVLDDAAIDAVRSWTYDPALRDGIPVGDLIRMPIRWSLARRS